MWHPSFQFGVQPSFEIQKHVISVMHLCDTQFNQVVDLNDRKKMIVDLSNNSTHLNSVGLLTSTYCIDQNTIVIYFYDCIGGKRVVKCTCTFNKNDGSMLCR
jgi:hypothetical protein